jgi:hypothetical protein
MEGVAAPLISGIPALYRRLPFEALLAASPIARRPGAFCW